MVPWAQDKSSSSQEWKVQCLEHQCPKPHPWWTFLSALSRPYPGQLGEFYSTCAGTARSSSSPQIRSPYHDQMQAFAFLPSREKDVSSRKQNLIRNFEAHLMASISHWHRLFSGLMILFQHVSCRESSSSMRWVLVGLTHQHQSVVWYVD